MTMKRTIWSLAVVLACGCGPDASALVGNDDADTTEIVDEALTASSRSWTWFPVGSSNTWTLKNSNGGTKVITSGALANDMAQITGLFAQPVWFGVTADSSPNLYWWSGTDWETWVRFGYSVSSWRTNSIACRGIIGKRISTGSMVVTAAGTFNDTRTIGFSYVPTTGSGTCGTPEVSELVFAAGVGPVSAKINGIRYTLSAARVGTQVFPTPVPQADVSAKVVLDRVSYVSLPNTIVCITTPCPSNAQTAEARVEFQLKNTGAAAASWQFSSGCQFDIELVSATGRVVKKLSDGRACTAGLTSLTLNAGQSKVFSATIPLADTDGLQLSGSFSARGKLIPSTGTAPTASNTFTVTVLTP